MTRLSPLLAALILAASCRRPAGAPHDAALHRRPSLDALAPDAMAPEAPPSPAPRWCFEPMARADLRAVDDEGRLWTLRGHRLSRDDDRAAALTREPPCPSRGTYALEFDAGGAAYAVVDGRFHVRATSGAPFVATPVCTDLAGAPWSRRAPGGWSVIARGWRAVGPGLLITREARGATGWYAITAIDRSITAGVLDGQQSLLSLVNGGRLILVDQVQTVAGEVLAARGESFTTLSRSAAGLVAARDAGDARRVLVTTRSLVASFERIESRRDRSAPTRAVVAVDLARFVAVTDDSVEVSVDRGRTFRTALRLGSPDGGGSPLERPHVGRLRDGRLAVATRDGLAVDRCP